MVISKKLNLNSSVCALPAENSTVSSPKFVNYDTRTFQISRILHPLVFGDYPETMRKIAGSRLPSFTSFESELVINSFDFIGLNHYTSIYVSNHPNALEGPLQDFTANLAAVFRSLMFVQVSCCMFIFLKIFYGLLFFFSRYQECSPFCNGEMRNLLLKCLN